MYRQIGRQLLRSDRKLIRSHVIRYTSHVTRYTTVARVALCTLLFSCRGRGGGVGGTRTGAVLFRESFLGRSGDVLPFTAGGWSCEVK